MIHGSTNYSYPRLLCNISSKQSCWSVALMRDMMRLSFLEEKCPCVMFLKAYSDSMIKIKSHVSLGSRSPSCSFIKESESCRCCSDHRRIVYRL